MGNVAATCSGQRHYPDDIFDVDQTTTDVDNSLKVWYMPFLDANPAD